MAQFYVRAGRRSGDGVGAPWNYFCVREDGTCPFGSWLTPSVFCFFVPRRSFSDLATEKRERADKNCSIYENASGSHRYTVFVLNYLDVTASKQRRQTHRRNRRTGWKTSDSPTRLGLRLCVRPSPYCPQCPAYSTRETRTACVCVNKFWSSFVVRSDFRPQVQLPVHSSNLVTKRRGFVCSAYFSMG